jgi:hypothetical protein
MYHFPPDGGKTAGSDYLNEPSEQDKHVYSVPSLQVKQEKWHG